MAEEQSQPELQKVLSYKAILLITINSILGTGIFFLPSVGAAVAGPASILSWAILSIIAIYIAMCFGELTSMYPKAGGIYEFCKQAYGPFWSFIIGWMTFIAGNITIAMLVVGAIQYLAPIASTLFTIPIALFFIYLFNYIAFKGMKTSAAMLIAFAFITLITLSGVTIPGLINFNPGNFRPFFVFEFTSIFAAIFFIAETFFGWETATFLAAETKDGEKVMPKALIISTIIIAIISLLVVISSLSALPWKVFGDSFAPISDLAMVHYGTAGVSIFTLLVYISIIGSVAGWIVSAPRLVLAMAEDKLFLKQLAQIHPKYFTPYKAIIFQTILTTILVIVGAGSYETLLHLLVPMVLVMYSATLLSLVVLRYKEPDLPRYYTAPFGKVGPIVIVAILFSILGFWVIHAYDAVQVLKLAGSFILFGVPIFLLLRTYYDPSFIIASNDTFARLSWLFEGTLINKRLRKNILTFFDGFEGRKILEFGCGVGTLTLEIAELVGPQGEVHSTDVSKKSIAIAQKRIAKKNHQHVRFIHDEHQINRVHPYIPKVDGIISVGMVGYLQDIKKVLKEMHTLLPDQGKICVVDYVDLFKILPNVNWLAKQDLLIEIFREAGFSVNVKKEKGLLWNYLYIYGIKSKEDVPFV